MEHENSPRFATLQAVSSSALFGSALPPFHALAVVLDVGWRAPAVPFASGSRLAGQL